MQVSFNFGVWRSLDIIGSHFLLVLIEVGQLFFHIIILDSVFLLVDVVLLLIFDIFGSELLVFKESLVFFDGLILLRLTILGFHFDDFGHSIELSEAFSEVGLVIDPLEGVDYGLPFIEVDFLDHAGTFLHLEEFKIVDYILYVERLLFFEQYDKWDIFKLSFRIQDINQELLFFIQRSFVVNEKYEGFELF